MTSDRWQWRFAADQLLPRWLRIGRGRKYVYAMQKMADVLEEWAIQGIVARFPMLATPDALTSIGRDRQIIRGFDESATYFRQRALRWLDDARRRGHAYSVLEQVAGYLSPHAVRLRIVTDAGVWYERSAAGTLSWQKQLGTWDWDGTTKWWRGWLIIYPPIDGSLWEIETTWGDGISKWGERGTIGTTATKKQVESIRTILRKQKPKHFYFDWIVISFDWTAFDPATPDPDGTWGPWSDSDPRVETRTTTARYWRGVSE